MRKYFQIFKSLRLRIAVLLVVLGMIPCIILRIVLIHSYEDRAVAVRIAEIQNQCTILSDQIENMEEPTGHTSEVIDAELSQFSNIYDGRVMLIDDAYQIKKDTYRLDEGKTIVSKEVIKCLQGKETSRYDGKNTYIEITVPIHGKADKDIVGVMLASVSTDDIADMVETLEGRLNLLGATIFVIVAVIAMIISVYLLRPFSRITKSIEAVTEGYDDNYLHEDVYKETAELSEAFNKMLGRFRMLDDSRQEFVSNVSHELKTPLTSMKVLADSLLSQEEVPAELYREFMADMSEEIERENKIINDLLSLVKMDKTSADLNITTENLNELVERLLKRLRPIAKEQNVEVVFESFRTVEAEVDEVKISLALSNLMENAIKYNQPEGWVRVSLNADHKYFYVKVSDSGIGIPKEAQEHIFERFYRVDKSHSREIGGTGLGLAIARNAVIMHRGAIKLHSEPGEGTTFTVRIPLKYVNHSKVS